MNGIKKEFKTQIPDKYNEAIKDFGNNQEPTVSRQKLIEKVIIDFGKKCKLINDGVNR